MNPAIGYMGKIVNKIILVTVIDNYGYVRVEMAKFEPARGPSPFEPVAGRDWLLRSRPGFFAGFAG